MAHYTNRHRSAAAPLRFDCSMLAADETVFLLPRDHGRRFDHRQTPPNSPSNRIQINRGFPHHYQFQFLRRYEDETLLLDFPNRSASEEAIARHVRSRVVRDRAAVDGGMCVVCQDDLVEGIARLDCGHSYHESCIKKWLTLNNTCPLCKATVVVAS